MARDNFPRKVIELAYKRVAGRCSNPSCRKQTLGPAIEPLAVVNIGVAAHICAAAPGGPRYRADMSSSDRRSFENLIWLCANCATKIDRDVLDFSAEILLSWKKEAEDRARAEQGNRLPESSDAHDQIAMALAGTGRKFMPQAIANVHKATESSLKSLDPRFEVQSEFSGGKARFKVYARENVPLSIKVGPESAEMWANGFTALLDQGRPVKLPMQGVSFEGSKLLEVMHEISEQGTLTITPNRRSAVVKFLVPHEGITSSEDINGTLAIGRRTLHFEGGGYGGLIKLDMDLNRLPGDLVGTSISISSSFDVWQGLDVRNPPYLDKVLRLLRCLVNAPEVFLIHLEIEGEHVLTGRNIRGVDRTAFEYLLGFAQYVERARTLMRYLDKDLPIDIEASYSAEDHELLANAADIARGHRRYERDQIKEDPRITVVCSDGGKELMASIRSGEFSTLQQRGEGGSVKVFGREIPLPTTILNMSPVRLHVVSSRTAQDNVEFEFRVEMGENFVCETIFE